MNRRRVLLVRFHDGTAGYNWGGRSTSLALAGLIQQSRSVKLNSIINGVLIARGFGENKSKSNTKIKRLLEEICLFRRRRVKMDGILSFNEIENAAELAISRKENCSELEDYIINQIRECDEVCINGEGDFILSRTRKSLWRTLFIICMSNMLGKKVHLLNSILSEPAERDTDEEVVKMVNEALRRCTSVLYRDPQSLRLHERLFPWKTAKWTPDALFSWSLLDDSFYSKRINVFSCFTEKIDPLLQNRINEGMRYVLVSGASGMKEENEEMSERAVKFANAMKEANFETVFVTTSGSDRWLKKPAERSNSAFVEGNIPLSSAMFLVANSSAFISGRYHPSIMATNLGVPTVYMESNSHKTLSLQEIVGVPNPTLFSFFGSDVDLPAMTELAIAKANSTEVERKNLKRIAQMLGEETKKTIMAI